jgi:hypothetical protein
LKVSGNPGQYHDLEYFINEQDEMRAAIGRTRLPHLEIDVSDGDVPRACARIADWMLEKRLLGYYDAPPRPGD